MADIKLVVDAGHGGRGSTPGKRDPDGRYEWDYNNTMVVAFLDELSNYTGIVTKRADDATGKTDVPLKTRTDLANKWGADFYISFHQNALTGIWRAHGGTETYYYEGSSKSKALAEVVQKSLLLSFGLRNRGIKPGNHLHVVRETKMPAILLEGGFMDSTTDIKVLRNTALLQKGARALAQDFAKWQNLKRKTVTPSTAPITKPTTPTTPSQLYRVRKSWGDAQSQIGAYNSLDSAITLANKNPGYSVFNELGARVYRVLKTHTVQKNETLWRIAQMYKTDVNTLTAYNRLNSHVIQPGMKLIIPE